MLPLLNAHFKRQTVLARSFIKWHSITHASSPSLLLSLLSLSSACLLAFRASEKLSSVKL